MISVPWSPYWSHVLGYWAQRNDPNIFFLTFEELKKVIIYDRLAILCLINKFNSVGLYNELGVIKLKYICHNFLQYDLPPTFDLQDLCGTLCRLAVFLEVQRKDCTKGQLQESELQALSKHLDFSSMKNNPAVNCGVLLASSAVQSGREDMKDIKFMRMGQVRFKITSIGDTTFYKT